MTENRFKNKIRILVFLFTGFAAVSSCSQMPGYSENSPSGSILINNGDFYTQTTSVTLSVDVPDVDEMCFSNDKVTWTPWEAYSDSKSWGIASDHWIKTVYGKFRKSGREIGVFSDSIYPLVQQKIYATDGVANANFGGGNWSFTTENICISADGTTVIVGAATKSNAVYVYKKNGLGWDEIKISPSETTEIYFGNAIACTPDAHILVIGGLYKPAFYVYEWNSSSYIPTDTIISPTSPQTNDFAVTLSISDDGNKIAVGSWHHPSSTYQGAVYLYERNKSSWSAKTYEKMFFVSDLANYSYYGLGVKISGDGNTIAIGAPNQDSGKGSCYIYKLSGSVWNMVNNFVGETNYLLGRHIAMSTNGKRIIVSERMVGGGNTNQGAAHIYDWDGSTYTETKILKASDGAADDKFGYCVTMSSDGNIVAVGAPGISTAIGRAYVYGFNGTDWIEEHKLTASDGLAGDFYGNMVAISGDGSVIAVGAPLDDIVSNTDQGSVYLYY